MYCTAKSLVTTVHLSQYAPVRAQDILRCVVCEHTSFTDISIIVADFLCGQVSSYTTFGDVRRSLCKNMTERRCVDLLYYLLKCSHILAHNDNIMTNLYKTSYSGYCNLRIYAVCVILTVHLVHAL